LKKSGYIKLKSTGLTRTDKEVVELTFKDEELREKTAFRHAEGD
jgi:hypothetical protein